MSSQKLKTHSKVCVWSIPISVLLIDPNRSDPINLPKLLALTACAFISFTLYVLSNLSAGQTFALRANKAVWLYVGFGVYLIAAGITGTANWVRALMGAVGRNNGLIYYIAALVLVVIILLDKIQPLQLNYLIKWIGITSLFFGSYCAIQFADQDPINWASGFNRIIGTLGNPNFSASLLGLFSVYWMFWVYSFDSPINSFTKVSMFCLSLLFAFLSWSTESLQGPLVVVIGFLLIIMSRLSRDDKRRKAVIGIFAIAFVGLSFIFLSFLGIGPLGESLQQYTLKLREYYMSIGLQAILNHPLNGVGVDSYSSAFRQYRDLDFVKTYGVRLYTDNAHSTPVQIGVSFGLAAFLLYCFIQSLILVRSLRILVSTKFKESTALKLIAILWILVFLQSLLSIENIGIGIFNWILGAFILGGTFNNPEEKIRVSKKQSSRPDPEWFTAVTLIVVCVSILPYFFVAREDSKVSLLSRLLVNNESDKAYAKNQLDDLTALTLLEPSKVSLIAPKLYEAGLNFELDKIVNNLIQRNRNDITALEVGAVYESNAGKKENEVDTRLLMRKLDPFNYLLEIKLAETLFELQDWSRLSESLARIQLVAPHDSDEYSRSIELQMKMENFQKLKINS